MVIGIIGLLLGMLLPSLTASRDAAKGVTCAAGLREQGRALTSYSIAHDGYMPLAGSLWVNASTGYDSLPPALNDARRKRYTYIDERLPGLTPAKERVASIPAALLGELGVDEVDLTFASIHQWDRVRAKEEVLSIFECPAAALGASTRTNLLTVNASTIALNDHGRIDYGYNGLLLAFDARRAPQALPARGAMAALSNAAESVLAADADTSSASIAAWEVDQEAMARQRVTMGDALTRTLSGVVPLHLDLRRHQGKSSVVYGDGHVELLAAKQLAEEALWISH